MSNRTPQAKTVPRSGEVARGDRCRDESCRIKAIQAKKIKVKSSTDEREVSRNNSSDAGRARGRSRLR